MKLIIVTGMSGSGKSKALNVLEDSGYYCLDNLPVKLIPDVIDMILGLEDFSSKVCVTIDVRNRDITVDALKTINALKKKVSLKVLFLDCDNSILLKRYKETRRLHPLMMTDNSLDLQAAIDRERNLIESVRQKADYIIDTSLLSTGDLKEKIYDVLPENDQTRMQLNFTAFGYKYGIPADCDLVFDVRCLPNPFYIDELKKLTGRDREVRDYVMSCEESQRLYDRIVDYLETALPMYEHEGKSQLVVGIGCTGGQHRSLTFAILLAEHFEKMGYVSNAFARDSEKNVKKIKV